jgi:hypothetical protein
LAQRRDDAASAECSTVLVISPELVLVDPELAQIARIRLAESAVARPGPPVRLAPPVAAIPRLRHVASTARRTAGRTMPTVLLLSLLLNLLFAAALFAGDSNAPTLEPAVPRPKPAASKSDAERAVLTLVARRAANGDAPRALVDRTTGLLKNNVLAVCRLDADQSFTCVVRPPQHRPREGLYVRYRPAGTDRPASVTWLGYRVTG